jgi:S-formylglutathione hydrolase FrmB
VHTVSFTCQVPAAPGSYTLPTALLSHLLPAGIDAASAANGTGILAVETSTSKPFTASLAGGGSLTFAAMSAVQAFSRNLAIQ